MREIGFSPDMSILAVHYLKVFAFIEELRHCGKVLVDTISYLNMQAPETEIRTQIEWISIEGISQSTMISTYIGREDNPPDNNYFLSSN